MIDGLKPYPAYKNSGVSWLGEVPEHWGVLPNRALFAEVRERGHTEEQMLSVTITRGVIPQGQLLEDSSKKDSSKQDKSAYKLVSPGDIAYNKMRAWQGAIGASCFRGIISPAYIVMRLREENEVRYFHYLFRTPQFSKEAERWSYGITSDMWSLRPEHFRMVYCSLPPVSEQSAIVRFLDHTERLIRRYIRAKKKLIKLLEEQKRVIIHRVVTRGLDPNVRLKHSGVEWLGEVPEHWEVRKLGSLGKFIKGRGIANSDITVTGLPAITYGDIYTRYGVEVKELSKCTSPEIAAKAQEINIGDLLFTASGETIEDIGKTTLYSGDVPGYAGGDIIILRIEEGNGLFISYALNSNLGIQQKSAFGRGDIIVHISATKLKQISIPLPPQDEAVAITQFLNQATTVIDRAIEREHVEITHFKEYRTRLFADTVTGKLDVREAAARLPEEAEEAEPLEEVEMLSDAELEDTEKLDIAPEEAEV